MTKKTTETATAESREHYIVFRRDCTIPRRKAALNEWECWGGRAESPAAAIDAARIALNGCTNVNAGDRLSCCMFGAAGKLGGVLLIDKVGKTA